MARRRLEDDGSSNPWDNLTIELFDYVLSGLSVKVLLRCRIVCKRWLRIIDCLYPWTKDFNPGKTRIFGCSAEDATTGPIIYAMIKKGDEMIPTRIASFPELRSFRHGIPGKVSSSNGLILLERHCGSRILESAVINPLTKEVVMVPGSPCQPVAFDNLTLGYVPWSARHKLVQLLVRDESNNLGAAIYNLSGEMGWRFIPFPDSLLASSRGAFENHDQERRGGVCVNDGLFWTLHGPELQRRPVMIYFHLRREEFRRLPIPRTRLERYELASVGRWPTLWDLSFGDKIKIWKLVKSCNKRKMWVRSCVMFLNDPIHTMDNVSGVYHFDTGCLLIQGSSSSTGESLFVMHDEMDRFLNCTLKDRSLGHLNLYSHPWN